MIWGSGHGSELSESTRSPHLPTPDPSYFVFTPSQLVLDTLLEFRRSCGARPLGTFNSASVVRFWRRVARPRKSTGQPSGHVVGAK